MSFSFALIVMVSLGALVFLLYVLLITTPFIKAYKRLVSNNKPFERGGEEYRTSILVLGDSLAAGVGSYGVGSLAERMAHLLNASVENIATSGAKMRDIQKQCTGAKRATYDYVLLVCGANDIIQFTDTSALVQDIKFAFTTAKDRAPRVIALTSYNIGAAPFWPFPFNLLYTKRTQEMAALFTGNASVVGIEYVNLLDFNDEFDRDVPRYYSDDLLHPSTDGYEVWFGHIQDRMKAVWGITPPEKKEGAIQQTPVVPAAPTV
jgi:lysophospholipase L1-like esterase